MVPCLPPFRAERFTIGELPAQSNSYRCQQRYRQVLFLPVFLIFGLIAQVDPRLSPVPFEVRTGGNGRISPLQCRPQVGEFHR